MVIFMFNDYLSILEFSKLAGVSTSKLRYWDKEGILRPQQRDPNNNYRRYSKDQLDTLNFITTLSLLGFSHKIINELLVSRNPEVVSTLLQKLDMQVLHEMGILVKRCAYIHSWSEFIHIGMNVKDGSVQEMYLDDRRMNELPRNIYNDGEDFRAPLYSYFSETKLFGVNPHLPMGWLYSDMSSFKSAPERPAHFLSIDPSGSKVRKPGNYLVGFVRGNYGELGDLPDKMILYAKKHSLTCSGSVYTMYVHTHICTNDPSQYLAKCSVAID
ncbi:MAG: MerR family transcriptional regulator [Oscillospiraceae bacterium]|nr:MerR family transcriptional regulator [Oscillospiraceae bacterium]